MSTDNNQPKHPGIKYPGIPQANDGSAAVVATETAASEAAGAYPITPSTDMGEGWAKAVAAGKKNVNGRNLIFFEPEGEHAAAGVTAGMAMVGLRSTNFSSAQGIAYMHESLYAAVGKRLTYVLNVACRAITKQALNVHAGHDDYHSVDDTGMFQLFAKDVQEAADLNLIAHRIAELSLNPGICAQDGFLTSHVIESFKQPEDGLVREFLGDPADIIDTPTPAQKLVFGNTRRRIPELYDFDAPALLGAVANQEAYAQGVAAQRPFYFEHIQELADQAFDEYAALSGRDYQRVSGYRTDDADYIILGQGSVVSTAEAVADHLRETQKLRIGVVNMTMFRPFPCDLVAQQLQGKKGVLVMERTDQPLAADQPLLREVRTALAKAQENGKVQAATKKGRTVALPYAGIPAITAADTPDFYSASFGMGSRDLQPGDMIAAVENMLPGNKQRRQFYLGIDFIQQDTPLPKQRIWQEQVQEAYPGIAEMALPSAGEIDLLPKNSLSLRIHSVGGWGAITMGKNVAMTASDVIGLEIKANPKYGSEKKGQPTTFYATLSEEKIRINCEVKHVGVVLSPDPKVFEHSNPLAGLKQGGVFVIQSDLSGEALWNSFPKAAQRTIRDNNIQVYGLNGFDIALSEASNTELRFRMQGVAFMGAFFKASPLASRYKLSEEQVFNGIRKQLEKKFGHLGERVIEDNLRVIYRGYTELEQLNPSSFKDQGIELPGAQIPLVMMDSDAEDGISNRSRFWDQVCTSYKSGRDIIADPFAALSAIPAATSSMRDMTAVRFTVPEVIADKCTGCAKCWTQCPDSAIPGVVNTLEELINTGINSSATTEQPLSRFKTLLKPLAAEARALINSGAMDGYDGHNDCSESFANVLAGAYLKVADARGWDETRRTEMDADFNRVHQALAKLPLAKTAPFWDLPERKQAGDGGLLSITINPETCKGCDLCVDVCADGALISVRQTDEMVDTLRDNWKLWQNLPETQDRYVKISDIDNGIGVLSSLLLKQRNYMSMVGGDGACMGCGEKTTIHMVLSAVNAMMHPRVDTYIKRLSNLIESLETKARDLISSQVCTHSMMEQDQVLSLTSQQRALLKTIRRNIDGLKNLHWRYTEGPTGNGRAVTGFTNATGCTSVWGATYPYNPYPFPWVNHLFQDAPSVAIGIFEGHMRKMADGFIEVRRAEKIIAETYNAEHDEKAFGELDWESFDDDEFGLCPPLFAVGGDGAMMDIGFQNLSRLLASDKPIRVMVVDTQVYSNTGGQACTSGFTGQVSDMAEFGPDQRGKEEVRKELSLLAMAHRGAFVLQSSQARPAHLLKNVLKGLQSRRPAIFILNTPCPPEWGIGDDAAFRAAELSLESRAVPHLVFDPDAGTTFSECLSLDGNPERDADWPTRKLEYVDTDGNPASMELPVTAADWAATEARFRKHFGKVNEADNLVPFADYVELDDNARANATPFIYMLERDQTLGKRTASNEMVVLAEERLKFWTQLKEMAGIEVSESLRSRVRQAMELEVEERISTLQAEYEAKIDLLKIQYPQQLVQKLARNLLNLTEGDFSLEQASSACATVDAVKTPTKPTTKAVLTATASAPAETELLPHEIQLDTLVAGSEEAWIESSLCTACDDCININSKLFAYDDDKLAIIKDPRAGTFSQLIEAAEICPAEAIHPGTPLDSNEQGLEALMERAERFN